MMNNEVPVWGYVLMVAGLIAFVGLIAAYVIRYHGFKRPLFAAPYIAWIVIFTVVPCLIVAYYSFTHTVEKKYESDEEISIEQDYTITVNKARVTIYAEDKCMVIGGEMPKLTTVVTGYSFGSRQGISKLTKQYVPVCTADVNAAGEYEITFDAQSINDTEDYDIVFVPGKLTVVDADEVMISVRDYEKVFDRQELKPTAVCSDPEAWVEYSTDGGENWSGDIPGQTNAGETQVLVRAVKDESVLAENAYTLKIDYAPLTVKVLNNTALAGGEIPEYSAIVLGLTYDKKDDDLIQYTLDANPGTKPGEYEVTAEGEEIQGNYRVSYENGLLYLTEDSEIRIVGTDFSYTYNGRKMVPLDYAFVNKDGITPQQSMQRRGSADGEFTAFAQPNIEHAGVYKVINTAKQDTYTVTEFSLDNFFAFWDSNFIARQKLQKLAAQEGRKISAGALEERGTDNFDIFVFSLWMAFLCTVICLLMGYPAAHIMADKEFRLGSTIIILFIVPMWMNFLLRTIAMMALLNDNGVINSVLKMLGMQPASLINNAGAVLLGMVYNFLPFMVFPIYNVLNKMDGKLSEAAMDLGCNKTQTFWKVTMPLSVPGVVSGITMVFMPAVTTFYISGLLGGGKVTMFGDLIESKFISTTLTSWNEGSALSLIMMVLILISIGLLRKADPKGEGGGAV